MNSVPDPSNQLPADLTSIARAADLLGAAERNAAPAGIEDRIAAATSAVPSLRLVRHERVEVRVSRRIGWSIRIAAAIALLVGGYGAYVALSPTAPTTLPGEAVASNEQPMDAISRELALLGTANSTESIERALAEAEQLDSLINSDFIDPALILPAGSM